MATHNLKTSGEPIPSNILLYILIGDILILHTDVEVIQYSTLHYVRKVGSKIEEKTFS